MKKFSSMGVLVLVLIAIMAFSSCNSNPKNDPGKEVKNKVQTEALKSIINGTDTSISQKIIVYHLAKDILSQRDDNTDVVTPALALEKICGTDSVAKLLIISVTDQHDYDSKLAYDVTNAGGSILQKIQQIDSLSPVWFYENKAKSKDLFFRNLATRDRYRADLYLNLLMNWKKDTNTVREIVASAPDQVLYNQLSDLFKYGDSNRVERLIDSNTDLLPFDQALRQLKNFKVPKAKMQTALKKRADEIKSGIDFLLFCKLTEFNDSAFVLAKLTKMSTEQLTTVNHGGWGDALWKDYCVLISNSIKNDQDYTLAKNFITENFNRAECSCYDKFDNDQRVAQKRSCGCN